MLQTEHFFADGFESVNNVRQRFGLGPILIEHDAGILLALYRISLSADAHYVLACIR
jgi:hypothetical protein